MKLIFFFNLFFIISACNVLDVADIANNKFDPAFIGSNNNQDTIEEPLNCPTGYVPVPANTNLSVPAFCVMKYEASNDGSGNAVSDETRVAWFSINQINAKAKCTDLGVGFDLISNAEWMSIGHNIENVAENWSDGVVGEGFLTRGWAASGDPFTNSSRAPHSLSTCLYNSGADGCSATGLHRQRRTHILSNGEEIWDLAGNHREWVDWSYGGALGSSPTTCALITYEFNNVPCADITAAEYLPSNPAGAANYDSSRWLGRFYGGNTGGATRGGSWNYTLDAGIFALSLNDNPTNSGAAYSFRCVFRP